MNKNLTERDVKNYPADLIKTLSAMAGNGGKRSATLSTSISDFTHSELKLQAPNLRFVDDGMSILCPLDLLLQSRALAAGTFAGGGAFIGTDTSAEVVKVLRARSVCLDLGARVISGLTGNYVLGKEVTATSFQWLHEAQEVTPSDQTFAAITLTPHRLAGMTSFTKDLAVTSAPDLAGFVIDSLGRGLGAALDHAGVVGSGVLGEPLGIYSTPGVNSVTFSTSAGWSDALSFVDQIADANGDDSAIAFAANPNVREKWMNVARFGAGTSAALWNDDGTIAGRPARVSTNVPSGGIIAGDFSNLVFGFFGPDNPVMLTVDPYAQKRAGIVEVLATIYGDIALTLPQTFVVNSGSAIQ